jgi:hypothetical protein
MSFPAPGGYPAFDQTATDNDVEIICRGCSRLTCQISNQPIYITFGQGDPPNFGMPEPYLPFMGQLVRQFDAFKVRSKIPLAQLPAGALQAHAYLIPLV